MKECQAKSSAGGEIVSEPKAPLQSGVDDVWSKNFRETPGGSLEVFNLGVWTSVPGAAADYIESIRSQQTSVREWTIEECARLAKACARGVELPDAIVMADTIWTAIRSLVQTSQSQIEEAGTADEVSQFGKTSPDTTIIKESDWDGNSY